MFLINKREKLSSYTICVPEIICQTNFYFSFHSNGLGVQIAPRSGKKTRCLRQINFFYQKAKNSNKRYTWCPRDATAGVINKFFRTFKIFLLYQDQNSDAGSGSNLIRILRPQLCLQM